MYKNKLLLFFKDLERIALRAVVVEHVSHVVHVAGGDHYSSVDVDGYGVKER